MKLPVATEVARLIRRPNVTARTQYYCVVFLSQMEFDRGYDRKLARFLVATYIELFEASHEEALALGGRAGGKGKRGKKGKNGAKGGAKKERGPGSRGRDAQGRKIRTAGKRNAPSGALALAAKARAEESAGAGGAGAGKR